MHEQKPSIIIGRLRKTIVYDEKGAHMTRVTGEYESSTLAGESVQALIPYPLPQKNLPLELHSKLKALLTAAKTNSAS
ncbi:MAG: hypothetical protein VYA34_03460 [Myxococcota bacterium]|nr:hypothetical protein [Myxococcota bacterium]